MFHVQPQLNSPRTKTNGSCGSHDNRSKVTIHMHRQQCDYHGGMYVAVVPVTKNRARQRNMVPMCFSLNQFVLPVWWKWRHSSIQSTCATSDYPARPNLKHVWEWKAMGCEIQLAIALLTAIGYVKAPSSLAQCRQRLLTVQHGPHIRYDKASGCWGPLTHRPQVHTAGSGVDAWGGGREGCTKCRENYGTCTLPRERRRVLDKCKLTFMSTQIHILTEKDVLCDIQANSCPDRVRASIQLATRAHIPKKR